MEAQQERFERTGSAPGNARPATVAICQGDDQGQIVSTRETKRSRCAGSIDGSEGNGPCTRQVKLAASLEIA